MCGFSTVSSVATFFGIGWEDGTQTWEGQRREYDQVSVQVQVKAYWQADGFHLDLENRPEDRNYVMFLQEASYDHCSRVSLHGRCLSRCRHMHSS